MGGAIKGVGGIQEQLGHIRDTWTKPRGVGIGSELLFLKGVSGVRVTKGTQVISTNRRHQTQARNASDTFSPDG